VLPDLRASRRLGPRELVRLLGPWPAAGRPAYLTLAARVRLLVLDGRVPVGVRLPPERELAATLGLSRTTVTATYEALRASGHAVSRQGSGTWTALPARDGQVPAWGPEQVPAGVLDLVHAAPSAPPQVHAAFTAALEELPRHLPGTGYDHRGLLSLRARVAERFTARGLPTTPEQVLVTSGGLHGIRLALAAVVERGDRVLVEQPAYPNGLDVVRDLGGRAVPVPLDVGADGTAAWDLGALRAAARQTGARAAYLVPDFHNPTGALMPADDRARVARDLADSGTLAVVDETLVELAVDEGVAVPPPFAVHARAGSVVTVGSASKVCWGGLRTGWLRADAATVSALAALRSRHDLAGPVLEQLATGHLLDRLDEVREHQVGRLREGRAALLRLLAEHLPDWRARTPQGGQVLWCRLPLPASSAVAGAAADLGVRVTPGARFAVDGTLEGWLRLPYTRPVEELQRAVPLLAQAWAAVATGPRPAPDVRPTEAHEVDGDAREFVV
jgi:DNA-binding transcriptional MocR family regulator